MDHFETYWKLNTAMLVLSFDIFIYKNGAGAPGGSCLKTVLFPPN